MPNVSVVIPIFNHAHYIREAIESVLGQSYKDVAIVVIDDGSTDDTKATLTPYIKEEKIQYFYQNNRGLSAARNAGLKHASGQYVKFLDSDDILYPEQIEKQVADLAAAGDEKAMSMTDFCMQGASGRIRDIIVPMVEKEKQLGHFVESNRGGIHTYLFPRKMVVDAGGFDEALQACEDFDLKLRLLLQGAYVRRVDYNGCCYRLLNTSMSNDTLHMFLEKCKVYEKLNRSLWDRRESFDAFLKENILQKNILLIDECLIRGLALGKVLPSTARLTAFIYKQENKGLNKVIYQCLGIKSYSRLTCSHRERADKSYRDRLLTQEVSWKIA